MGLMSDPPADTPRSRFVWPPRPVARVSSGSLPDPGERSIAGVASQAVDGQARPKAHAAIGFRAEAGGAWRRAGTLRVIVEAARQVVREAERVWLGVVVPPLAERLTAAGWQPDTPGAYCPRCARSVGPFEADATGCSLCRETRLPWERIVRLGEYGGVLREAIHDLKFTCWRQVGLELGRMLGESLRDALRHARVSAQGAWLAPVPATFRRRMVRGVDHAMVLARGVSEATGVPVLPLMTRCHRPPQASLPASRRRGNVAGTFRISPGVVVPSGVGVIVDDITTTRATLAAAARAIRRARSDVRLWGAVVAAVGEPPGGLNV